MVNPQLSLNIQVQLYTKIWIFKKVQRLIVTYKRLISEMGVIYFIY